MLTRKPRIGERLHYDSGSDDPRFRPFDLTVRRFDSKQPGILWFVRDGQQAPGESDLIIWQFRDGLNKFLSHIEPEPEPEARQDEDEDEPGAPCDDCARSYGPHYTGCRCSSEPDREAPQAPPAPFPRTRAALEHLNRILAARDTRTGDTRRNDHAIAVAEYAVQHAYRRDLELPTRTRACLNPWQIRGLVNRASREAGAPIVPLPARVPLSDVDVTRGPVSVGGGERRAALLYARLHGMPPAPFTLAYRRDLLLIPIDGDDVAWPESWRHDV